MARRVLASISRKSTGFPWDSTRCFVGLFPISTDRNRIGGNRIGKVSLISRARPVTTHRVKHLRDEFRRRPVQRRPPLFAAAALGRRNADGLGCTGYKVAQAELFDRSTLRRIERVRDHHEINTEAGKLLEYSKLQAPSEQ
jgi:hypothetical protein